MYVCECLSACLSVFLSVLNSWMNDVAAGTLSHCWNDGVSRINVCTCRVFDI